MSITVGRLYSHRFLYKNCGTARAVKELAAAGLEALVWHESYVHVREPEHAFGAGKLL